MGAGTRITLRVLQKYLAGETSYAAGFVWACRGGSSSARYARAWRTAWCPASKIPCSKRGTSPRLQHYPYRRLWRMAQRPSGARCTENILRCAARRLVDALSDAADGGAAPPGRPPAAAPCVGGRGFSLLSATRGDGDESARRAAKACMRALRCGGVDGYAMVGGGRRYHRDWPTCCRVACYCDRRRRSERRRRPGSASRWRPRPLPKDCC